MDMSHMADEPSFDCSPTADLFCNEEISDLCFADDSDDVLVEPFSDDPIHQTNDELGVIFGHWGLVSEALIDHLPCLSEECIGWMVKRETAYLPRDDYLMRLRSGVLDKSLRKKALYLMLKVCTYCNFGELCLYLAMSYFDRFLSLSESPIQLPNMVDGKWEVQLVSVTCLSLAAKIEEVYVPSTIDLQAGDPQLLFEGKTLQNMEMKVLTSLNWKIKSYTPFNFIDYFLSKMIGGDEFPLGPAIARSLQIILCMIEGIDFLEFKPSEIAAAVAIHVLGERQAMDSDKTLSSFILLEEGRVVKCLGLIQELMSNSQGPITTAMSASEPPPDSPNGVLEASACLSWYEGDDGTSVGHVRDQHTVAQSLNG